MSGYNREDIIGYNRLSLFKPASQNSTNLTELDNCLNQQGMWHEETRIITRNGQLMNIALSVSPIYNQDHISHTLAIYNNITPLKETQKKLEQLAYFDPLTGVPNRFLLMDRLHQAMASCQRNRCLLAICYLDLDGFKPINDTLGHEQGDVVLKTMAERLQSTLRSGDTIARLGGDEFVLLLTGFSQIEEYTPVLQRLMKNIQQPCKLLGKQAHLSASIGVSIYPMDGQDADTLMLELVESAAIKDIARVTNIMQQCQTMGISFALDDFGTGYSSLTYFRQLPASLLHLGCEQVQGYAIAKPMPVEQIEDWCKSFTINQLLNESQASHNLSLDDIPLLTLEADHRIWIENIAKVLRGDTRTIGFPLEETACRFGRWYYDHGQKRYAHLPSFANLESLHSEVHRLAQELITLHAKDPQQALNRLPELYDIRNRLISQLQQLQVEAIRQQLDQS